jgi:predicted Zn-dependent protease with MMP-like domain
MTGHSATRNVAVVVAVPMTCVSTSGGCFTDRAGGSSKSGWMTTSRRTADRLEGFGLAGCGGLGPNDSVSEPHWPHLLKLARDEVERTIGALPGDLQPHAHELPVSYESWPSEALLDEGWDPDLLGMFVGDPFGVAEGESSVVPRQILLFLENLWDFAEGDEALFREEIRITYLHEFGHYLGLDEAGLEARGLL